VLSALHTVPALYIPPMVGAQIRIQVLFSMTVLHWFLQHRPWWHRD